MKLANRKRIEELEKVCKPGKKKSSYGLVIYDGDIHDQIETLEVDADFVVCLPDNRIGMSTVQFFMHSIAQ
jgi:hypothetical protein